MDQLVTLAEAGKLQRDDLFFDPKMETWAAISSSPDLSAAVFPEKKRLSLRRKEQPQSAQAEAEDRPAPVKVTDMLAAAEGYTKETEFVREAARWRERTASLAVPTIGAILLLSALTIIYPSWSLIQEIIQDPENSWMQVFTSPLILLGLADAIMGILILLNATELFPVVRLRAALGAGFFATLHGAAFINGDPVALWLTLGVLAFGTGLFTCTLTLNFRTMVSSAILGVCGILTLAWFQNIQPLLSGS
jgi:hypothetical protein